MSKTLVIVDCQYGFVDGGELPVGGGNKAVEFIINYIRERGASVSRILMTVDNHPAYHGSFKESEPFHIRIEGKSEESKAPRSVIARRAAPRQSACVERGNGFPRRCAHRRGNDGRKIRNRRCRWCGGAAPRRGCC